MTEPVRLTREHYDSITQGMDLREYFRDRGMLDEEVRLSAAIFLVLYEIFPNSLGEDDLIDIINERNYMLMQDGAFLDEVEGIISAKVN